MRDLLVRLELVAVEHQHLAPLRRQLQQRAAHEIGLLRAGVIVVGVRLGGAASPRSVSATGCSAALRQCIAHALRAMPYIHGMNTLSSRNCALCFSIFMNTSWTRSSEVGRLPVIRRQ